jgi:hypothetical protein
MPLGEVRGEPVVVGHLRSLIPRHRLRHVPAATARLRQAVGTVAARQVDQARVAALAVGIQEDGSVGQSPNFDPAAVRWTATGPTQRGSPGGALEWISVRPYTSANCTRSITNQPAVRKGGGTLSNKLTQRQTGL